MRHAPRAVLVVLLMSLPASVAGAAPCLPRCSGLPCHLDGARCLMEVGQPRKARRRLKALRAAHPGHQRLLLLLASAYWAEGNRVWAARVLAQAAGRHPDSCQVRSFLVWLLLQQAELDRARELLVKPGCPDGGAMSTRWHLLRATLARYRDKAAAAAAAAQKAQHGAEVFPEDRALLDELRRSSAPLSRAPVRVRLDLGGGYTSNGLMSSPADVAATGAEAGSPALGLDARLELEPPWGRSVRPVAEVGLRSLVLTAGAASDYTHVSVLGKAGVAVLDRLRVLYAGQVFLLTGGDLYTDGPRVFYEAHRAEVEVEPTGWISLWAGVGRALFRERVRTRIELDGGVAVHGGVGRLLLLGGAALRGHWAAGDAYDLVGGMVLGSATHPVGPITARVRLLVSYDGYLDSEGYFTADTPRHDWLLKGTVEAWSPAWHGLRVGLAYDLSKRFSTADTYAYIDHRPMLRLSCRIDWDPWAPRTAQVRQDHVRLPIAAGSQQSLEEERIQDILRREDAARRGSSCVN